MIQNTTYQLNHKAVNVYHPLRTQYDFWKETIVVYHLVIKSIFVQSRSKYQTNHCSINFQLCHTLNASQLQQVK